MLDILELNIGEWKPCMKMTKWLGFLPKSSV